MAIQDAAGLAQPHRPVVTLQEDTAMDRIRKPSKESVRAWLMERLHAEVPPHSPGQIREQLRWFIEHDENFKSPMSAVIEHQLSLS